MRYGYTIVYVADVEATLAFYERAFGLARRFLHESGQYGELDTGATTLAFSRHDLAETLFPGGYAPARPGEPPAGVELGLVTEDVAGAYARAVAAGATPLKEPAQKPWGQTVGYVRDLNGVLIELCTPMG
ncbi:MAG TPA: VOC family protein [Chloroflexaceae bacterium]|nr:VOC family protein [Chloroflexaceae bacterium]